MEAANSKSFDLFLLVKNYAFNIPKIISINKSIFFKDLLQAVAVLEQSAQEH